MTKRRINFLVIAMYYIAGITLVVLLASLVNLSTSVNWRCPCITEACGVTSGNDRRNHRHTLIEDEEDAAKNDPGSGEEADLLERKQLNDLLANAYTNLALVSEHSIYGHTHQKLLIIRFEQLSKVLSFKLQNCDRCFVQVDEQLGRVFGNRRLRHLARQAEHRSHDMMNAFSAAASFSVS